MIFNNLYPWINTGVWGRAPYYGARKSGERGARNERGKNLRIMHVLSMTGIDNGDGIAIDGISIIPFVSISHVIVFPTRNRRLASKKRLLYLVHSINCIINILMHQPLGVSMSILLGYIIVEWTYPTLWRGLILYLYSIMAPHTPLLSSYANLLGMSQGLLPHRHQKASHVLMLHATAGDAYPPVSAPTGGSPHYCLTPALHPEALLHLLLRLLCTYRSLLLFWCKDTTFI